MGVNMKKIQTLVILSLISMLQTSCLQKSPYEIKSPCVSSSSNNPYAVSPCTRKPANSNIIL